MQAIQINGYGGNEVVTLNANAAKPTPTEGQLLVEMRAAGINPVDWKIYQGYLQAMRPVKFPFTLGMDFSGIVVAVGEKVTGFRPGDEVYGMSNIFSGGTGTLAEFFLVDANACALKPKNITHAEAAALPMAGISALQALTEYMQLTAGEKILIHGGAGGIGAFAIQLAKHLGLYVATTVSGHNEQWVKTLGADEVINYKAQSFEHLLQDYAAVFDTVGGDTYAKSFEVLKKGGTIVSMLAEPDLKLMEKYAVNAAVEYTQVSNTRLSQLSALIDHCIIKVYLAKIFAFDQAKQALEYMQHGHPRGKIVVTNGKQ